MNFLQSDKKVFWILFAIYFIVNIPIFINFNGIYWDDWVLYNQSFETINNMFLQAVGSAAYPTSVLHYFLINYIGLFSYRVLTFMFLFLNGWFVFKILSTLSIFSNKDKFFITLFFITAPLYSAKIALINFPYTFYSTFFFFGFYLLSVHLKNLRIFKRVFILFLFFVSFLINSILVFYAIVLMYMFYKLYDYNSTFFRNSIIFVRAKFDFVFLPVSFFVTKIIYFAPSNLYEGYNGISLKYILFSPLQFINTFYLSFSVPIVESLSLLVQIMPFIFIIFSFFLSKQLKETNQQLSGDKISELKIYLILGILFFFFGSFAYLAVGKIPNLNNWDSRFQLLLPLGFSFVLYYGIKIISYIFEIKNILHSFILFLFLISFSLFHIKDGIDYNKDWIYQQSIIENFKDSEIIKNNSTFIIENKLGAQFVKSRTLNFYELNGISREAFGTDNKLFVGNIEEITVDKKYRDFEQYNFSTWQYEIPLTVIFEDNKSNRFHNGTLSSIRYLLKLKYLELFKEDDFKKEIKNLITINYSEDTNVSK